MLRRSAMLAAAILLAVGLVTVGPSLRAEYPTLTLSGDVQITPAPDGSKTAITIDIDLPGRPADGVVDRGFRVQHRVANMLAYSGKATLIFAGRFLIVQPAGQPGWAFTVGGVELPADLPPVAVYQVAGIANQWGQSVRKSKDQVTVKLLTTGCNTLAASELSGDPACDTCQTGGPGADSCSATCSETESCDASCSAGYYACCNCPSGCGCCPSREQRPQALATSGITRAMARGR